MWLEFIVKLIIITSLFRFLPHDAMRQHGINRQFVTFVHCIATDETIKIFLDMVAPPF